MTIRIDQLNSTVNPERDHEFPSMRDGVSVKLRAEQILAVGNGSDPQALKDFSNVNPATGRSALDVSAVNTPIDDIPSLGLDPADLNVQKAIEATFNRTEIASTEEAVDGENNTKIITPLQMRQGFNASGLAPVFACRAWVNFNGTTTTPNIRSSGNVSSVARNSTGDFTINFATAMPDSNYCAVFGRDVADSNSNPCLGENATNSLRSTTQLRIINRQGASGSSDSSFLNVSIFR